MYNFAGVINDFSNRFGMPNRATIYYYVFSTTCQNTFSTTCQNTLRLLYFANISDLSRNRIKSDSFDLILCGWENKNGNYTILRNNLGHVIRLPSLEKLNIESIGIEYL